MINGCVRAATPGRRAGRRLTGPRYAPAPATLAVEIVVEPIPADEGRLDIVQEWGEQSFPASDPPANW